MKFFNHILSEKGILAATVILLTIAAVLAIVGMSMEATDQLIGVPSSFTGHETVTWLLTAGVMGDVPSTAGTLQSLAFFVAYVVTPLVVAIMFAIKVNFKIVDDDIAYAA
jgi:hypothetical protein